MNEIKCPKCGTMFKIDETDYASILKQVRDTEFEKQIQERKESFEREKKDAILIESAKLKNEHQEELNKLQTKITELENNIKLKDTEKESELLKISNKKDQEIKDLENKISLKEKEYELEKKTTKEKYDFELQQKDELIDQIKNYKAKQSTKMIGESLEQHCHDEFDKLRPMFGPNVYFEKDNDSKTGSKGDFIYREYDEDNHEIVSIMFEMKNEMDTTATKHKNEDFLKELDKDRNEKKCEYAVLVSLLESDSELYNQGIVDVSHRYNKMYVIRPQFFIPLITLIRNLSLKSLEYKRELNIMRNQNIDITNFESAMNDFKDKFNKNYQSASNHYATAIQAIDDTIKKLQKIKDELTTSGNQLRLANDKLEDLTIKKLVKNNPTMAKKFASISDDKKLIDYAESLPDTISSDIIDIEEI